MYSNRSTHLIRDTTLRVLFGSLVKRAARLRLVQGVIQNTYFEIPALAAIVVPI